MSDLETNAGSKALAAALERARRNAGTAIVAAALVPLALTALSQPAQAVIQIAYIDSGNSTVVSNGSGGYSYSYSFTSNEPNINEIILPEVQQGEYLSNGSGGYTGFDLAGWSVSEVTTAPTSAPGFKYPNATITPAAWLEIATTNADDYLGTSGALNFTLESDFSSISANGLALSSSGGSYSFDPPSPDPIPEPASLALLGVAAAGAIGARRKRR